MKIAICDDDELIYVEVIGRNVYFHEKSGVKIESISTISKPVTGWLYDHQRPVHTHIKKCF